MRIANKPFDADYFFFFDAGEYNIGIENSCIPDWIAQTEIKVQYLLASTPLHTRFMPACAISKFLISLYEFSNFIEETNYLTDAEKEGWGWILRDGRWQKMQGLNWKNPFGNIADEFYRAYPHQFPVLQVSWNDAYQYCCWLSHTTKRKIGLPTELLWENFTKKTGFPSIAEVCCDAMHNGITIWDSDCEYLELVKRQIDENGNMPTGVFWEWCADWYDSYDGMQKNKDFGTVYKVLRGGTLRSHVLQRTREYRFRRCPTARSPYYGFRISVEFSQMDADSCCISKVFAMDEG
ncbi:MAG: formylglycine-generating enzyme family protein [Spirochaetes bacterium]|nr:formylglycine-generating enzyme family protein [Spirochaetota bacterium]